MKRFLALPLIVGVEERSRGGKLVRQHLNFPASWNPQSIPPESIVLALGVDEALGKTRAGALSDAVGKLWEHPPSGSLVFVTYHPNYVLRRTSLLPVFKNHLSVFKELARLN